MPTVLVREYKNTKAFQKDANKLARDPSTAKRHLADLPARSGLTTEQLIYRRRTEGWLLVPSLELR